jgi:diguanylate cyclase (GGDEF)-like protein
LPSINRGIRSHREPHAGTSAGARSRSAAPLWRGLVASAERIPTHVRVWALTAFLAALAVIGYAVLLVDRPGREVPIAIPWPVIAFGFLVAELKVVQVHFRRETHAFSLSEFPAVIGMFFLPPGEYLLAVLVGSAAAFVMTGSRPVKLAFNLANYGLIAVISMAILLSIASPTGPPGIREWAAAFGATTFATVLSSITIALVITLSGGAPQFQKLPEMIQFGSMVALANTSLALLAVTILWLQPIMLWLLVLPLVMIFVAYQAYISEREKHERLELLYESSRILQLSPEIDFTLVALLSHARTMFRSELAEVVLYPRSPDTEGLWARSWHDRDPEISSPTSDALQDSLHDRVRSSTGPFTHETRDLDGRVRRHMVSALRGESEIIGSMVITNRLTEGTSFGDDDLRLLETLANQTAVALENGHLEQSLAELSRLKEQLRHQAYHDPLTGLPNRTLFLESVGERMGATGPEMPVVMFLDLDDFKVVNDTLGHDAGDRLLCDVAGRLRTILRSGDIAARLGGDEFAILLDDDPGLARAEAVADRIIDALRATFPLEGQEITIGVSIGIAAARTGISADELLRNADVAMYTAKATGKNRVSVFEPTVHAAIVARHELSAELSRSLGRGELHVFYQPIVELATRRITGVEALIRWQHPVRGLIGPSEFVHLAEETRLIRPLGRWVLLEACRQAADWAAVIPGGDDLTMSVNLSAQQLQEPDFVNDLRQIIADTGIRPHQLVLEMTETVMFHDTLTTLSRLEAIRDLGVRIAIDDFGTGYSSLGYLRRFRVDILKIARDFIGPAEREEEWAFASAIVAIGRSLGVTMIAEGIEETGQLDRLLALGCELGQGYLFARPARAEDIGALLGVEPASDREAVGRTTRGTRVASSSRRRTMAIDPT